LGRKPHSVKPYLKVFLAHLQGLIILRPQLHILGKWLSL
jgi:hypothetical protein